MYRADLHCHSTCSDGTYTPIELLHLAKNVGLSALCITDHDTLDAYTEETYKEAENLQIKLFMGVEFSSRYLGHNIHILGYGVTQSNSILEFCKRHVKRRKDRNLAILQKLKRLSFPIEEEELYQIGLTRVIGRPHIAQIMVEKGYVNSIQDAFDRYLGDSRCCYVIDDSFTAQETIDQIHEAHGKAFLAHPHVIRKTQIITSLLALNFDGIECYYSLLDPAQEKKWLKIAHEKNLLISGGSDFHGTVKPQIQLGCSYVDENAVEKIFNRH